MESVPFIELGKYGLPGLVAVIALWFARQRMEAVDRISELRISDWKAGHEIYQNVDRSLQALTQASEMRNRAADAQSRTLDLAAQAAIMQATEIQRLREVIAEQVKEVQVLRDHINRHGGAR